jgi:hypothetical protein
MERPGPDRKSARQNGLPRKDWLAMRVHSEVPVFPRRDRAGMVIARFTKRAQIPKGDRKCLN